MTRLTRRDFLRRAGGGMALAGFAGAPVRAATGPRAADAVQAGRAAGTFHLGLVSYNVARDWDLDTMLHHARAAGFEGVEFRTTHAHGVEPSLDQAARAAVKRKCAEAGMTQVSLGTTCEFQSPDPDEVRQNIETCRHFVGLARDLGARGVKVRPNGLPDGVPVEKTLDQIGRALRECGDIAADQGVEIWMEVHGRGTQDPPNSRRIMDACGHASVGVTWNSNATDVVDGSVKPSFDLLRPFIRCCHITDLWSDYPYHELFALLADSGYDRFTLCEYGEPVAAADGVAFLEKYRAQWNALQG